MLHGRDWAIFRLYFHPQLLWSPEGNAFCWAVADPSIVAQTWRNSLSLSLGTGKHIPKTISLESEGQQRAVFIIISYPRFVQARRSRLYKPSCQRCTWTRSFACTRLLRNINISEHLNISKLPNVHLGKRLQQPKNVAQKSFKLLQWKVAWLQRHIWWTVLPEPSSCDRCQEKEGEKFAKHVDGFLSGQFFSLLYKQCDFSRIVFPIQDMSICSGKQWRWLQLGCLSSLKLEIQVHGSLARGAFPYFLTRARASGGTFRAVCEIPPAFRKQYFTKNFTHFYSIIVIYYIAYFQWWTWHFIKINFFGLVCWDK